MANPGIFYGFANIWGFSIWGYSWYSREGHICEKLLGYILVTFVEICVSFPSFCLVFDFWITLLFPSNERCLHISDINVDM